MITVSALKSLLLRSLSGSLKSIFPFTTYPYLVNSYFGYKLFDRYLYTWNLVISKSCGLFPFPLREHEIMSHIFQRLPNAIGDLSTETSDQRISLYEYIYLWSSERTVINYQLEKPIFFFSSLQTSINNNRKETATWFLLSFPFSLSMWTEQKSGLLHHIASGKVPRAAASGEWPNQTFIYDWTKAFGCALRRWN